MVEHLVDVGARQGVHAQHPAQQFNLIRGGQTLLALPAPHFSHLADAHQELAELVVLDEGLGSVLGHPTQLDYLEQLLLIESVSLLQQRQVLQVRQLVLVFLD